MGWETMYIVAGLLMAAYYLPQLRACAADDGGLRAYSLPKALTQLGCRLAMLPFVVLTVDSKTMLLIQGLDVVLRAAELFVAVQTLRRQDWTWTQIWARATHRMNTPIGGAKPPRGQEGTQHGSAA